MSAGWRGSAGQVRRNFGQLSPHRTTGNCFSRLSAWTTTSTFFLLGRIHLGAGSAGLLCRAGGAAGGFSSRVRRSATGVSRWPWPGNLKCTIWSYTAAEQSTCEFEGASQPFAKKKRAAVLPPRKDWNFCDIGATNVKETRLGEPVLGEPVLIGRAIKRGWGEPSNEVGASHQTRLGEPVLRGRWASRSLGVGRATQLSQPTPAWRYGASARARSALCLLGTFS